MGIESEPSRTELLEKVVEMRERGGAQGGISETRARSCRQRNKEEELGVEMG